MPLARELAAVVARSPFGQGAAWPVVETVQRDGICVEVLAPGARSCADDARRRGAGSWPCGSPPSSAWSACSRSSCSRPTDGARSSTSWPCARTTPAHWTIEGARTSQFEQHLRAVLDYPLGDTALTAPVVVMANVLGGPDDVVPKGIDERVHHLFARWPGRQGPPVRQAGPARPQDRARDGARATTWTTGAGARRRPRPTTWLQRRRDAMTRAARRRDHGQRLRLADVMEAAAEALAEFDVPYEVGWSRRTAPRARWSTTRSTAAGRGLRVIIAGAGGAAHLPGMVASLTTLPVIGVPVPLKYLDGMDSLLSIVQMPAGVPVATVSIGGARNAGLLAVRILAARDAAPRRRMATFQEELRATALAKDAALQQRLGD